MALSDEQIDRLMNMKKPYSSAKAIERAVLAQEEKRRKDDEALIRQMLEAVCAGYPHLNAAAISSDEALNLFQQQIAAITAARARLGEKEGT